MNPGKILLKLIDEAKTTAAYVEGDKPVSLTA
jgi:hypothetical protein